jgi:hypothetical protein
LALFRVAAEIVAKSVSATKRASVSVTGGGVAIGFFLIVTRFGNPLSELGERVYV